MGSNKDSSHNLIDKDKLVKLINRYLLNFVDVEEKMEIKKVYPETLITSNRIDVVAKYCYANSRIKGTSNEFIEDLYINHLQVLNGFNEGDYSIKKTKEHFIESFNELIDSMQLNGFSKDISIIPVNEKNEIIDGAHRLGTALALNKEVYTVKFKNAHSLLYNTDYFRNQLLQEEYLDYLIHEYSKIKKQIYVVVLFPSANDKFNQTKKTLGKYGNILLEKSLKLTERGKKNLIISLYRNEPWVGNYDDGFYGADNKVNPCFTLDTPLKVYFFEKENNSISMVKIKEEIRTIFNIGKHSVHINDTYEETLELCELFLNKNSLHHLNNSMNWYNKKFGILFHKYKEFLSGENLNKDNFCIELSGVLGAYGLREPNDIDYITLYDYGINIESEETINKTTQFYSLNKNELIYNPRNYFYYNSYKFLSLETVKTMKMKRGEQRDIKDIVLIENLIGNNIITENHIIQRLETVLDNLKEKKIIFFGSGSYAESLMKEFKFDISYIIDNNRDIQYKSRFGKIVYGPEQLFYEDFNKIVVIIASSYSHEIITQLESMGLVNYENFYSGKYIENVILNTGSAINNINFYGMNLYYDKGNKDVKYFNHRLEKAFIKINEELNETANTGILDIGAKIGLFTFYFATHLSAYKLYSIEPNQNLFNLLKKNITINNLNDNIKIFNSEIEGVDIGCYNKSLKKKKYGINNYSLDRWWENNHKPLIKLVHLNADGKEIFLLKGGMKFIEKVKPLLVFLYSPIKTNKYFYDLRDFKVFFTEIGYSLKMITSFENSNGENYYIAYPKEYSESEA